MIEPRQIRAARALLDWTREDLSKAAGISVPALTQIEGAHRAGRNSSLDKIRVALETAGVVFTDNTGVKMKSEMVSIFEGAEGFKQFSDDRYMVALNDQREFLMYGGMQESFVVAAGADYFHFHAKRMATISGFKMRALMEPTKNPDVQMPSYIELRYLPENYLSSVPFYVYGPKLAIIVPDDHPRVIVINDEKTAESYRRQFELFWRISRRRQKDNDDD